MAPLHERTEDRDGMRIDWNVPIAMDDGLVLRADVFRPVKDGTFQSIRMPSRSSVRSCNGAMRHLPIVSVMPRESGAPSIHCREEIAMRGVYRIARFRGR